MFIFAWRTYSRLQWETGTADLVSLLVPLFSSCFIPGNMASARLCSDISAALEQKIHIAWQVALTVTSTAWNPDRVNSSVNSRLILRGWTHTSGILLSNPIIPWKTWSCGEGHQTLPHQQSILCLPVHLCRCNDSFIGQKKWVQFWFAKLQQCLYLLVVLLPAYYFKSRRFFRAISKQNYRRIWSMFYLFQSLKNLLWNNTFFGHISVTCLTF